MPTNRSTPWSQPNPKKTGRAKLTPANLAWAKARAKKAGRRYPNLVDNMAAACRQREAEAGGSSSRPDRPELDHP
jgi:hypothetical protein